MNDIQSNKNTPPPENKEVKESKNIYSKITDTLTIMPIIYQGIILMNNNGLVDLAENPMWKIALSIAPTILSKVLKSLNKSDTPK